MMTYLHKGIVLRNGVVEPDSVTTDEGELAVLPGDDGLHIVDFQKGDFEWWYFDMMDQDSSCFLKIVIHIGTDPLRTRIFPQLAVSVDSPDRSGAITHSFSLGEFSADTRKCNISLGDRIQVRVADKDPRECHIEIDVPGFQCNLRVTGSIEGWKPLGNEIVQQLGNKRSAFSWVVPMPRAIVEGEFHFESKHYKIRNAVGYHDHNYIKVEKESPLYVDDLISRWYWGKFYAADYSVIFMDTHCRTNRILSLMVSDGNRIIYSANNLIDCTVVSYGFDPVLKTKYPEYIHIKSTDAAFQFQAELQCDRISDRKDLLEQVNPVARFLIRTLVAKPAYHGILASVRLQVNGISLQGAGNFESMVFRGK
jgi:hypothetical protein